MKQIAIHPALILTATIICGCDMQVTTKPTQPQPPSRRTDTLMSWDFDNSKLKGSVGGWLTGNPQRVEFTYGGSHTLTNVDLLVTFNKRSTNESDQQSVFFNRWRATERKEIDVDADFNVDEIIVKGTASRPDDPLVDVVIEFTHTYDRGN